MRAASIGIDIGTSAVKVAVVDLDGLVVSEASRPYPTHAPQPGWAEQTPEDWWNAACAAVRDATSAARTEIVGIGLSGQLNGIVLLDQDNAVLGNAIVWLDIRAAAESDALKRDFDTLLRERAGTDLTPIAVLAKLAWLARHDSARLGRARRVLLVKDYLLWRLTGVMATDPSDAVATGMVDVGTLAWIPQLCRAAGVDPAILPPIVPSMAVAGQLTAAAAAAMGLPEGLPVLHGAGDVAALAVGCGVSRPGIVGITLGTAGHVVLAVDAAAPFAPGGGLWRIAHADPAQAIWLGLVMSGGLSLSWLHRMFSAAAPRFSFEAMTALAEGVPWGARGVSFVPFLEGSASPHAQSRAQGLFGGLSSSTSAGDMIQAVMEGVAFNVRQCIELFEARGAEITQIRVAEGGARVDRWCQILADILQRPLVRLDHLNTSSLGAALMAQAAVKSMELSDIANGLAVRGRRFTPNPASQDSYAEAYRRYRGFAADEIARAKNRG